jgi:predicted SnoaL-like aldol condensation-catalyzing enzyme
MMSVLFRLLVALCLASSLQAAAAQDLPAGPAEFTAAAGTALRPGSEAFNEAKIRHLSNQLYGQGDLQQLGRSFARDLIQHRPEVANGRAAMLAWIAQQRAVSPQRRLLIKHLIADRDLVFVHAQVTDTPANEFSGLNRYDFYRLDDGLVVEYWSVEAPAPRASVSGNSAFSDLFPQPAPRGSVSPQREALHRSLVRGLSEDVFGQRNFGLLDRFWAAGYLQHNPFVGNGRAALAAVIDFIAPAGSAYRVVRALAGDDLVVVCAQSTDPGGDPRNEFSGTAVCDLYRVNKLELVEHWDVLQAVPQTSASGNSMFSSLYRGH